MWERQAKKLWPKLELFTPDRDKENSYLMSSTPESGEPKLELPTNVTEPGVQSWPSKGWPELRKQGGLRLAPGNHTFCIRVRFLR